MQNVSNLPTEYTEIHPAAQEARHIPKLTHAEAGQLATVDRFGFSRVGGWLIILRTLGGIAEEPIRKPLTLDPSPRKRGEGSALSKPNLRISHWALAHGCPGKTGG